jgi:hypothetical protein
MPYRVIAHGLNGEVVYRSTQIQSTYGAADAEARIVARRRDITDVHIVKDGKRIVAEIKAARKNPSSPLKNVEASFVQPGDIMTYPAMGPIRRVQHVHGIVVITNTVGLTKRLNPTETVSITRWRKNPSRKLTGPHVCIVDFEGYTKPGHFHTSMWADWYPHHKFVRFGGDWNDVPDMPATSEPTEEAVEAWAAKHAPRGNPEGSYREGMAKYDACLPKSACRNSEELRGYKAGASRIRRRMSKVGRIPRRALLDRRASLRQARRNPAGDGICSCRLLGMPPHQKKQHAFFWGRLVANHQSVREFCRRCDSRGWTATGTPCKYCLGGRRLKVVRSRTSRKRI